MKSGPECTHTLQNMITEMQNHLEDEKKRGEVLDLLGAGNHHIDNGDIQLFLAENFVLPVQYSQRSEFCEKVGNFSKEPFLQQLKSLMDFTGVEWGDYDRVLLANETLEARTETDDMRQWTYQFCTEFGWFQTPSTMDATHRMRSELLNDAWWFNLCTALYGNEVHAIRDMNVKTIGKEAVKGKILYVNSIEDPWLGASILPRDLPDNLNYIKSNAGESLVQV